MEKIKIVYYNVKVDLAIEEEKDFSISLRIKTKNLSEFDDETLSLSKIEDITKKIIEQNYPTIIYMDVIFIEKITLPCFSDTN